MGRRGEPDHNVISNIIRTYSKKLDRYSSIDLCILHTCESTHRYINTGMPGPSHGMAIYTPNVLYGTNV